MWNFIIIIAIQVIFRGLDWECCDRLVIWHAWEEVAYLDFVAKREAKRPLGRPRYRGKDGIKSGLKTGLNGMGKLIWLSMGHNGIYCRNWKPYSCHKIGEISWRREERRASEYVGTLMKGDLKRETAIEGYEAMLAGTEMCVGYRCADSGLDTYIHTYIHTYMHTYLHTFIHAYIHTYIHTYIHIYKHIYLHTYIYTYTHTYTYTYIYIYIHTYILWQSPLV